MNKYSKPNFLMVGVGRAGTTSIAKYLEAHPDIFIPKIKELRFFVKEKILQTSWIDPIKKTLINSSILDEKDYFDIMNSNNSKLVGDASIHYFNHPEISIPLIQRYVGDIPIIIILRNPVDRLISNWRYMLHDIYDLEKSLELENQRKKYLYNSFWFYKEQSIYSDKVEKFINNFSRVKVILFEEFFSDIEKNINECFDFLDLNKLKDINYSKIDNQGIGKNNPDEKYKNRILCLTEKSLLNKITNPYAYYFLSHLIVKLINRSSKTCISIKNLKMKKVSDKYKRKLQILFKDDISKLEKLINKDLSIWDK